MACLPSAAAHCDVVVADDNHDSADSLVLILNSLGYSARAVYDGNEAVEACDVSSPDLAILDVQMPGLDGCAAARAIRIGRRPPRTIASITALRSSDEPMKSQGSAFDVALSKPARLDEIQALLTRSVGPARVSAIPPFV